MGRKHQLLILMCLITNCLQIINATTKWKCIPHVISKYFGNTSINIIYKNVDDLMYLKDVQIPFQLYKPEQMQLFCFIYPNFVIHIQREDLEDIVYRFPLLFTGIEKVFIITNAINGEIDTVFSMISKYNVGEAILINDGVSPMLYTYQAFTGHDCNYSPKYSIVSKQYCDIDALLIERKSLIVGHCQLIMWYPEGSLKGENQFVINQRIIKIIESTLNVSIEMRKPPINIYNFTSEQISFLRPVKHPAFISDIEFDEMVWIVPKGQQLTTFEVIATTFDKTMWAFILASFIVTFVSWCLLIFFTKGDSFPNNYIDCFIVLIQLTLSFSLPQLPRKNIFRIILVFYAFYSLHICALFGANLVTILTVPKFKKGISSIKELIDSKITIVTVQDMSGFVFSLNRSKIQEVLMNETVIYNDTISDVLQNIVKYRNLSLFMRKKFLPKEYEDNVDVIIDKHITNPVNIGFYFIRDYALIEYFRKIIVSMREAGLTDMLVNQSPSNLSNMKDNSDIKLSLNHLQFAFLLLVGGLLLACLSFLVEIIWRRYFSGRNSAVIPL